MASHTRRRFDPEIETHKAWMGLVQPVGLVVAPPALRKAQVFPDKAVAEAQQAFAAVLSRPAAAFADPDPVLLDFPRFAADVLGWQRDDLAGAPDGPPLPERLAVHLPDYGETLRPTYAVVDAMADGKVLLLVSIVQRGADLDKPPRDADGPAWHASPQARLERLLRDAAVPAGLLCNGDELRLVYAPRGESSGHIGFPVAEMATVGGRPILAALIMLLGEHRLLGAADGQRLLDLMVESRKYQSEVSNRLSEQVLGALWDLLRGFQAADELAQRRVLYDLPLEDPEHVYGGLLTVIMRLVFLLYAEDQGLMPDSEVYARNYSIGGLYERLREDAGRFPDTMDQRFGAWAWLLTTFRLVFDGGGHGALRLPTRHGQLFNPDEYPFLEGRARGVYRAAGETFEAPRVSDGVVWRVLEGLLVLDGERLSYRALDVEQVGSVYESMMGFDVRTTAGRAVALRPKDVVVDLDALLEQPPAQRAKWLKEHADADLSPIGEKALREAATVDAVMAALDRRVSPQTPRPLPPGALFLQPGEERRRSGSHYTPRELTEPIVRTTLRPVLEALGERPTPAQILDLKVCDPAMGSGAFLVETCRQLAAALVNAWEVHDSMPALPPDEDPLLHARRLVAQRCLYGVDKNRFAVSLARLSLWLVTLARDHAFTFLDHALKHGDSLVGLTREQIASFHWQPKGGAQLDWIDEALRRDLEQALGWRNELQALDEGAYDLRRAAWREAEDALARARRIGDVCVAAFFGAEKDKEREALRSKYRELVDAWRSGDAAASTALDAVVEELRSGDRPLPPLHWALEFPEVFQRTNPGFDAMVGNPPFLGGSKLASAASQGYTAWLAGAFSETRGKSDLVAYFLRKAFALLRRHGCMGMVTTNTVREADTRYSGLRRIRREEGVIYDATRRVPWPGMAAVVVCVVHITRGEFQGRICLDGSDVETISAYLLAFGPDEDPWRLHANAGIAHAGVNPNGKGFVLSDEQRARLVEAHVASGDRIAPYLGSVELNTNPSTQADRYVIRLTGVDERTLRTQYPALFDHLYHTVRLQRQSSGEAKLRDAWWEFSRPATSLYSAASTLSRVLASGRHSTWPTYSFQSKSVVFSDALTVFALETFGAFAVLQSDVHGIWSRFQGSSLKDDLRYIPEDCFETFPFPADWTTDAALEAAGQAYYAFRAALMVRNDEGMTKTYNRFHDPDERNPDIAKLRALHAAMDRAVLDAYGWQDIPTTCDFFLDYDIDEATWGTKKKPWRYRWPNEVHDDVLARLLDLNQKRHDAEVLAGRGRGGGAAVKGGKAAGAKGAKGSATAPAAGTGAAAPADADLPPLLAMLAKQGDEP